MMCRTLSAQYCSQRGAALPLVLVAVLFLTLLGFMAMTTSSIEVRLAANERDYQQAIYIAEAGVAHARALVKGLFYVCNQAEIASGKSDWDFVLRDDATINCPALTGQSRPLKITANLGNFQYVVEMINNADEIVDPSPPPAPNNTVAKNDVDKKLIIRSTATGPTGVRAGIEVVLLAENPDGSELGGYGGQEGGGPGRNSVGRDARAITNPATSSLGSL